MSSSKEISWGTREFVLALNVQSEYGEFANKWQIRSTLRKIAKKLGGDAWVDCRDPSYENRFVPPDYFLRWGFKRREDGEWTHNFTRVGITIGPLIRGLSSVGIIDWQQVAEIIAFTMTRTKTDPKDFLCLTIANKRRVLIVSDREALLSEVSKIAPLLSEVKEAFKSLSDEIREMVIVSDEGALLSVLDEAIEHPFSDETGVEPRRPNFIEKVSASLRRIGN